MTFLFAMALLCLAVVMAASLRLHVLLRRSRKDRIDLRPRDSVYSGRSLMWLANVLDTRNYRPETGKAIVRGLLECLVVQGLAGLAAFAFAFWAMADMATV
jgi:hypothetical protein